MSKETLEKLSQLVEEWIQAADGQSLENILAPVGLVLQDVCSALDLEPEQIGL